jgi:glycosyltransferase involved in cell wall biosynthesis
VHLLDGPRGAGASRSTRRPAATVEPVRADHVAAPAVVIGVTADESVRLLHGFPDHLAEQGWTVHVVSSPGSLAEQLGANRAVQVHGIAMERGVSPGKDLRALLAWIRLLRRLKPDLVYVGTPKAGLLGGLAGLLTRVPARIYLLRGLRSEGLAFPWSAWLNRLERISVRCAHAVVCVSPSLREAARRAGVLAPDGGVVLGSGSSNGVRSDLAPVPAEERVVRRSRYFADPGRFTVGFVGRVTRDKGLDTLAEALAILTAAGLSGNCMIVGGDDGAESAALRSAVDDSGWTTCHLGQVADPIPALSTIDVLCLPSRREGFPNVVLEAAMVTVPCVGSTATGVVDAVVHGVTGRTVPVGDAPALADALADLMTHPDERHRLGRAARQRALAEFAREDVWAAQASFLMSMLATTRPVGADRRAVDV